MSNTPYTREWAKQNSYERLARDRYLVNLLSRYLSSTACILDVGCGAGSLVALWHAEGFVSIGFDSAEPALAEAESHSNAIFIHGDILRDELPKGFDLITINHLLEHMNIDESQLVMSKIVRSLKPSGLVCVSVPNLDAYDPQSIWRERLRTTLWDPYHLQALDSLMLKLIVLSSGLSVADVWTRTEPEAMLNGWVTGCYHRIRRDIGKEVPAPRRAQKASLSIVRLLAPLATPFARYSERNLRGEDLYMLACRRDSNG